MSEHTPFQEGYPFSEHFFSEKRWLWALGSYFLLGIPGVLFLTPKVMNTVLPMIGSLGFAMLVVMPLILVPIVSLIARPLLAWATKTNGTHPKEQLITFMNAQLRGSMLCGAVVSMLSMALTLFIFAGFNFSLSHISSPVTGGIGVFMVLATVFLVPCVVEIHKLIVLQKEYSKDATLPGGDDVELKSDSPLCQRNESQEQGSTYQLFTGQGIPPQPSVLDTARSLPSIVVSGVSEVFHSRPKTNDDDVLVPKPKDGAPVYTGL
jgi:hypothetical protein